MKSGSRSKSLSLFSRDCGSASPIRKGNGSKAKEVGDGGSKEGAMGEAGENKREVHHPCGNGLLSRPRGPSAKELVGLSRQLGTDPRMQPKSALRPLPAGVALG